jgi:flagellar export protein FliJ
MKAFHTLLKLAERELETLRRALAQQITRLTAIEDRIAGHAQTLAQEQKRAMQDYESMRAYSGYAVLAAQQRAALESEKAVVETEIERLRELIAAAHVEARKFERLIELEEERARAALAKREDAALDEFATLRAARTKPA